MIPSSSFPRIRRVSALSLSSSPFTIAIPEDEMQLQEKPRHHHQHHQQQQQQDTFASTFEQDALLQERALKEVDEAARVVVTSRTAPVDDTAKMIMDHCDQRTVEWTQLQEKLNQAYQNAEESLRLVDIMRAKEATLKKEVLRVEKSLSMYQDAASRAAEEVRIMQAKWKKQKQNRVAQEIAAANAERIRIELTRSLEQAKLRKKQTKQQHSNQEQLAQNFIDNIKEEKKRALQAAVEKVEQEQMAFTLALVQAETQRVNIGKDVVAAHTISTAANAMAVPIATGKQFDKSREVVARDLLMAQFANVKKSREIQQFATVTATKKKSDLLGRSLLRAQFDNASHKKAKLLFEKQHAELLREQQNAEAVAQKYILEQKQQRKSELLARSLLQAQLANNENAKKLRAQSLLEQVWQKERETVARERMTRSELCSRSLLQTRFDNVQREKAHQAHLLAEQRVAELLLQHETKTQAELAARELLKAQFENSAKAALWKKEEIKLRKERPAWSLYFFVRSFRSSSNAKRIPFEEIAVKAQQLQKDMAARSLLSAQLANTNKVKEEKAKQNQQIQQEILIQKKRAAERFSRSLLKAHFDNNLKAKSEHTFYAKTSLASDTSPTDICNTTVKQKLELVFQEETDTRSLASAEPTLINARDQMKHFEQKIARYPGQVRPAVGNNRPNGETVFFDSLDPRTKAMMNAKMNKYRHYVTNRALLEARIANESKEKYEKKSQEEKDRLAEMQRQHQLMLARKKGSRISLRDRPSKFRYQT